MKTTLKIIVCLLVAVTIHAQVSVTSIVGVGKLGSGRYGQYTAQTLAQEFWGANNSAYSVTNQPLLWIKGSGQRFVNTDATAVTEAIDFSGRGNNLGQATGTKQPTFLTGYNTLGMFRFDGGDCLTNPSIAASTYSMFIVMSNSAHGIIYEHSADASANDGSYCYSTTTCGHLVRRAGSVSSKNGTTGWGINNSILTSISYDGTHAGNIGFTNGTAVFTATCSASADPGTNTVTTTFNVGGRNNSSTFLTGHIYEMLWYSPKLGTNETAIIEAALKAKYGYTY